MGVCGLGWYLGKERSAKCGKGAFLCLGQELEQGLQGDPLLRPDSQTMALSHVTPCQMAKIKGRASVLTRVCQNWNPHMVEAATLEGSLADAQKVKYTVLSGPGSSFLGMRVGDAETRRPRGKLHVSFHSRPAHDCPCPSMCD